MVWTSTGKSTSIPPEPVSTSISAFKPSGSDDRHPAGTRVDLQGLHRLQQLELHGARAGVDTLTSGALTPVSSIRPEPVSTSREPERMSRLLDTARAGVHHHAASIDPGDLYRARTGVDLHISLDVPDGDDPEPVSTSNVPVWFSTMAPPLPRSSLRSASTPLALARPTALYTRHRRLPGSRSAGRRGPPCPTR